MADPQPTILPPVGPSILPPSNDNSGPTTSTPQGQVQLPTPPPSETPAWTSTAQNAATIPGVPGVTPTLSADVSVTPLPGQDTASGGGTKPDGSDVPKDQRAYDPTKVPPPPAQQPAYNGPPPYDPFAAGQFPAMKAHIEQLQKDVETARAANEEMNRQLMEMYKKGQFDTEQYRQTMNQALENERIMVQKQNQLALNQPTRSTNDAQIAVAGMSTALGAIGGRLANPTSALIAMGAATNAAVDRNDELFKQHMDAWKLQADLVGHGAELESKLQADAVAAAGNNSQMLVDKLRPLAAIMGNTSLMQKLDSGAYDAAIKQVQDYQKLAADWGPNQLYAQAGTAAVHQVQMADQKWSMEHGGQPVPDEVHRKNIADAVEEFQEETAGLGGKETKPTYSNWQVPDPDAPGKTKIVSAAPSPTGKGLVGVDGTRYPTGTKVSETQGLQRGQPHAIDVTWPDGSTERLSGWDGPQGSGTFITEQGQTRDISGAKDIEHPTQAAALTNMPAFKYPETWEGMREGKPPPGIPEDIYQGAVNYVQTGRMPALGMQSAQRAAINRAVPAAAHALGVPPLQMADNWAKYQGYTSGQRALGTRAAALAVGIGEAAAAAPAVIQTSQLPGVSKSEMPAVNQFGNWLAQSTGDPDVVRFRVALNTFLNTYARAVNPQGRMTDQQQAHAYEILSTSMAQGQVQAGVAQLLQELGYQRNGLQDAVETVGKLLTPGTGGGGPLPPDVPRGSVEIGTVGGKRAFLTPDGQIGVSE